MPPKSKSKSKSKPKLKSKLELEPEHGPEPDRNPLYCSYPDKTPQCGCRSYVPAAGDLCAGCNHHYCFHPPTPQPLVVPTPAITTTPLSMEPVGARTGYSTSSQRIQDIIAKAALQRGQDVSPIVDHDTAYAETRKMFNAKGHCDNSDNSASSNSKSSISKRRISGKIKSNDSEVNNPLNGTCALTQHKHLICIFQSRDIVMETSKGIHVDKSTKATSIKFGQIVFIPTGLMEQVGYYTTHEFPNIDFIN